MLSLCIAYTICDVYPDMQTLLWLRCLLLATATDYDVTGKAGGGVGK